MMCIPCMRTMNKSILWCDGTNAKILAAVCVAQRIACRPARVISIKQRAMSKIHRHGLVQCSCKKKKSNLKSKWKTKQKKTVSYIISIFSNFDQKLVGKNFMWFEFIHSASLGASPKIHFISQWTFDIKKYAKESWKCWNSSLNRISCSQKSNLINELWLELLG